jgi:hypothetical protein
MSTHGGVHLRLGLSEFLEQLVVVLHTLLVEVAERDELGGRACGNGIGVELKAVSARAGFGESKSCECPGELVRTVPRGARKEASAQGSS